MKLKLKKLSLYGVIPLCGAIVLSGCAGRQQKDLRIPALEYSRRIKQQQITPPSSLLASSRLAAVEPTLVTASTGAQGVDAPRARFAAEGVGSSDVTAGGQNEGFTEYRSLAPLERDYNGPLALGDPGLTASLWRESSGGTDMFRDQRAFAPMDLITVIVSEKTKATADADTETKESADISASIPNLLGFESTMANKNPQIALANLITAAQTNNFKGEGSTTRQGDLTAKISAVVVELLPGGLMRIEGEKIISLNSEEQVLVITGLVRGRDVNSKNEVDSSKIANLRVDYYGSGIVGEAQNGGWLSRLVRKVWPF